MEDYTLVKIIENDGVHKICVYFNPLDGCIKLQVYMLSNEGYFRIYSEKIINVINLLNYIDNDFNYLLEQLKQEIHNEIAKAIKMNNLEHFLSENL